MAELEHLSQLDRIYDEESAHLEDQWRRTHFQTMQVLSAVAVLVELLFSFILRAADMVEASTLRYYLRYLIIPALVYAALDAATYWLSRLPQLSGHLRNYLVSFSFALMCLAFCFFHDTFVVVYVSGIAAISLTTIYGDRKLTGLVTLFLILSTVLLAMFNRWDATVVRDGNYYINVALVVIVDLCTYLISSMIVQWEDKRRHAVVLRQIEIEHLREAAIRDQLTGVRNRLGLRRHIAENTDPMVYVMIDIDHFKSVNDKWGHDAGDHVLKELGRLLLQRETDQLAAFRYGGDEFLLTFTNTPEEDVHRICEQIAADFLTVLPQAMQENKVALSFGISPFGAVLKPSEAIHLADQQLYEAKQHN
jgi:diguanylate cyclase (GGDEF)-like protein